MTVKSLSQGSPDVAQRHETVLQAAVRMQQRAVGSLVVVDDYQAPIGIVTDRDLVERVLAAGKDPGLTKVGDVMTPHVVTIEEHQPIADALMLMRRGQFRRLPIVNDEGNVSGLIALDDIIASWAVQAEAVAQVIKQEMPATIAEARDSRWE
ncbi:CBS domain-containing protein [Anatilimnocola sp. NA78]|uniref:CBS domain-containing protein n=1 Tax=Anatilimnocola sp. NA78 TaxID=3415683 RepID=UPI003CE58E70